MTLDNMTGITKGSYTGFCKSQLITCNFVKACNGVCPFEDALKHADKRQTMNEQPIINHDRDWIIGCIEHDGFIHTYRFDKANQIIHDALSADRPTGWIPVSERLPKEYAQYLVYFKTGECYVYWLEDSDWSRSIIELEEIVAWMPLPDPYKGGDTDG